MDEGRIRELLQRVDQASRLPVQDGLAQQVRQRARRQQQIRMTGAAAAIFGVCLIAAIYVGQRSDTAKQIVRQKPADGESIQVELARLESEAELHALVAERMWAMEEMAQRTLAAEKAAQAMSPLEVIEQQRQRAAMIIVDQADRHLLNNKLEQAAAKEYRQAIALFPDTHGATLARRRLEQMGYGKEG